ncbi:hypothetical protein RHMOL_Rhmol07G0090700 [Rhododendron molle]|uniref:Uncharacterized protein n=1 Tax=Rhododendron molle TaxID=49168 RepID=A0ACC0MZU7_RHOML|nr:hypothetical protein RHMOL_Rhmol07G0090700 [Rhododendron molle]
MVPFLTRKTNDGLQSGNQLTANIQIVFVLSLILLRSLGSDLGFCPSGFQLMMMIYNGGPASIFDGEVRRP